MIVHAMKSTVYGSKRTKPYHGSKLGGASRVCEGFRWAHLGFFLLNVFFEGMAYYFGEIGV